MTEPEDDDVDDEESSISFCADLIVVDNKRSRVRLVELITSVNP